MLQVAKSRKRPALRESLAATSTQFEMDHTSDTTSEDHIGEDHIGEDPIGEDPIGEDAVAEDSIAEDPIVEDPEHEGPPPALKSFALTLQFYSSKAYEFVRKTFDIALPSQSQIRRWYGKVAADPGFTKPAFNALQQKMHWCSWWLVSMNLGKFHVGTSS